MKKLLLIAILASVTCFVSCSKDEDLSGTTWSATVTDGDHTDAVTLKFTSEKEGSYTAVCPVRGTFSMPIVYTYEDKTVSFTIETTVISGKVDGNKMTLTGEGEAVVFTKQ